MKVQYNKQILLKELLYCFIRIIPKYFNLNQNSKHFKRMNVKFVSNLYFKYLTKRN